MKNINITLALLMTVIPVESLAGWAESNVIIDNSFSNSNVHDNWGGRKLIRIKDTTHVLVPYGNERIYESNNDGASWAEIDNNSSGIRGSLITAPDNYVYHFYQYSGDVKMVKYLYDATTIPAPVDIYASSYDSNFGAYTTVNATIDEDGRLYVFYHYDTGSGGDSIFLLRSVDDGDTWTSPITVKAGTSSTLAYGYMHSDVTSDGDLILGYSKWGGDELHFAVSSNYGTSWTDTIIDSTEYIYNPAVLPVGSDTIYYFAQSTDDDGVVFKKSTNSGSTWGSWQVVQGNTGTGYGDPSAALGSDGTIYVGFRGSSTTTTLSSQLRPFIAQSTDGGTTWTYPWDNSGGNRSGSKTVMRYQTWYNYGGYLEWTWLQETSVGSGNYYTYYNINDDISLMDITEGLKFRGITATGVTIQ